MVETFRTGGGRPIVAIDIDGTLGDYHSHFLWFAEQWLGYPMPSATEVNPGMRLSTFMGIPHELYRQCKLAYRQGGLKRFMPCYPFASELTQNIRAAGAEIWICTSRPYLRLDNIDPDTREWLRRNEIRYNAVIFEGLLSGGNPSTKYADLVYQVGTSRIVAVIDDLPIQTADAKANGIPRVYIRDQPYNREPDVMGLRVCTLEQFWTNVKVDIEQWKGESNGL